MANRPWFDPLWFDYLDCKWPFGPFAFNKLIDCTILQLPGFHHGTTTVYLPWLYHGTIMVGIIIEFIMGEMERWQKYRKT